MTASVVSREWNDSLSPWSDIPPLRTLTPLLRGADTLRRSLIPSLLHARSENENSGNTAVELFEVAKVYLPRPKQMPSEPWMLSIVSEQSFAELKGILEAILRVLRPDATFDTRQEQLPFLDPARTGSLHLDGRKCAVLGQCSNDGCKRFELQRGASVAELCLDQIVHSAILVSQHVPTSTQPAVERDLNLILNEGVLWSSLRQTVRQRGGNLLEAMEYRETYRDPEKDGPGKKRVLFSLRFRAPDRTLTGSEVDAACQEVLAGCLQEFGAKLLA
jgi:phenylalanyl-tRNA synthetase beta chain